MRGKLKIKKFVKICDVFLIEKCSELKLVSKTSLITILGANVDCVYSIKTEEKKNTTGVRRRDSVTKN